MLPFRMPESHIFPILEPELHIESEKCECGPVKEEDRQTGEIRWIHKPLIIDDIVGKLEML
jgi:hypothetical protein